MMDRHSSREKSRNENKRESGRAEKKKEKYKEFFPDPYYERSSSKKKQSSEKSYSREKYVADPKYHDEKYEDYERSHKYEPDYPPETDTKSNRGSKRKPLVPQSRESRSPVQSKRDHKRPRYQSPSPKPNKIEEVERGRSREKKHKKQVVEDYGDSYEQDYHSHKQYEEKDGMKQKYHNVKGRQKHSKGYEVVEPRKQYDDNFQYEDRKHQKSKEFYQDDYRNDKHYKEAKYLEPQQKYYKEPQDTQKPYQQSGADKKFKDGKNYDEQKYYKDDYAKKSFKDDQYVEPHKPDLYDRRKKEYKEKREDYNDEIEPQKNYKTKDQYSQRKYEKQYPDKRQTDYYSSDQSKKSSDKHGKVYDDQKYHKDGQYDKQFTHEDKYYDEPDKYQSSKKQGRDFEERYDEPSYSKSKDFNEQRSSNPKKSQYFSPQRDSYSGNGSIQTSHSQKSSHKKDKGAVYSDHYSDKEERMPKKIKKADGEKSKKKSKVEVNEEVYSKPSHKQGDVKKKHKEVVLYSSDEILDAVKYESKQKATKVQKFVSGEESETERKKLKVKKKKKQKQEEDVVYSSPPPKKKNKEILEEEVKDKKKAKKRKRTREFSPQSFSDDEVPVKMKKTKHVEKNEEEWKTVDVILDSPPAKPMKKKKSKDLSPAQHRHSDTHHDSHRGNSYDEKSSRSSSQNRHYDAPLPKQHHKEAKQEHPRDKYQDQRPLDEEQRSRRPPRSNQRPIHEAPHQHDNYKPNFKGNEQNFDDQSRDRQFKSNYRVNVDHRTDSDRSFESKGAHYQKSMDLNRYNDDQGSNLYKNNSRDQRKPVYDDQRFSDSNRGVNTGQTRREPPRNKDFQQDYPRPHSGHHKDWQHDKRQPRFEQEESRNSRRDWNPHNDKNQQHPSYPKPEYSQDGRITSWKGSELRIKTQSGGNQREKWMSPSSGNPEQPKYGSNFRNLPVERNRFSNERSSPSSFPSYREVRNRSGDHRSIDLGLEVTIREDGSRGKVGIRRNESRSPARLVASYKANQNPRKAYHEASDSDSKKPDYKTPTNRFHQRTQNNVPLGRPHSHDRNPRKFDSKHRDVRGRLDTKSGKQERSGSDRDRSHASTTSRSSTRSPRRQRSQRSDYGSRKSSRRNEKDSKPGTTKSKSATKDATPKKEIVGEAADVLEVDWKELGKAEDKENMKLQEDNSVLQRFTPGNMLLRMGFSTDLLPKELVEQIKSVCENEKKSTTNKNLPLVLDQGLGALNRNAALSHQSWANSFKAKSKTARLTSYADAQYRCNILGISPRDLKYPIQPPQIINARTYAASLKHYANKVKLPVSVQ